MGVAAWEHGGLKAVATRAYVTGQLVLAENPAVHVGREEGGDRARDEWRLTRALLEQGRRGEWAAQYVATQRTSADDDAAAEGMAAEMGLPLADVAAVHAAVCGNAFVLETPLLGCEYGAGWYDRACRLNHSCAPNCASVRQGPAMVIRACAVIGEGQELQHSYLPPWLLVQPYAVRAPHLPFRCVCERCEAERGLPAPPGLGQERTAAADALAAVRARQLADGDAGVLASAAAALKQVGREAQSSPGVVIALATAVVAAWHQLGASPSAEAQAAIGAWCRLAAEAAVELPRRYAAAPAPAVAWLQQAWAVLAYVHQGGLKQSTVSRAAVGLQRMAAAHSGLGVLSHDLTLIARGKEDEMAAPPLGALVEAVWKALSTRSAEFDAPGLELDRCAACGRVEPRKAAFQRCSRCKGVKYCSAAHQREHWPVHKAACKAHAV